MEKIRYRLLAALCFVLVTGLQGISYARTNLATLPDRDATSIRLGNQENTLIQERRILTLQKGLNQINFSWQGVMIDPSSILLQPLSHPDQIQLLCVSYPPNESALIWQIFARENIQEEIVISYLLADIDSLVTYKAIADKEEKAVNLKSFLVLRNFSGEDFQNAHLDLHSGKSLNTSIKHLMTKQILFFEKDPVPIQKKVVWDARTMPHEPEKEKAAVGLPTYYEIFNQKKSNLGDGIRLDGKVRIFQKDGQKGTIFLGEDHTKMTPVGEKMTLHIGDSRDIVVTRRVMDTQRSNVVKNDNGTIELYDEAFTNKIKIENMKQQPVTLVLIEHIQGQWEPVDISMDYTLKNAEVLEFEISLEPKEKKTLEMKYIVKNIFAGKFKKYNWVSH
ncbi:MAG: DUF4139 domain-containing protein [Desulfobacteraceae bacterium]|nr:DUF4139 domain-containing protein [Desulfobacteraceae bacterium]